MWRWLLGGLGGLVGMMLKHAGEDSPPMTAEQLSQLEGYIGQLNGVLKDDARNAQKPDRRTPQESN